MLVRLDERCPEQGGRRSYPEKIEDYRRDLAQDIGEACIFGPMIGRLPV